MQTSQALIDLIKTSEGFRPAPYRDPAGLLTVGYGHRVVPPSTFTGGCTMAMALAMLDDDIDAAEDAIVRLVHVPLSQGQFDALVDFVYNLGVGRLAGSTLLKMLNAGNYVGAGEQLLLWDKAAGKVLPGLATRRKAEYKLWRGVSDAA